ncbi:acyltransferase family protein [Nocardioides korecus]
MVTSERVLRPEVQALRAAAVLLVVGFHLWPVRLTGGYVGVDVFFVISGFLITSHLLREVEREGRVSFGRFWARRARRLLPAAYTVLAAAAVATYVWLPRVAWEQSFREIIASSLYVQNWRLAADAVDYLAADNAPSPVQHYWTLSVEEQFYLVWPVLLVLTVLVARRMGWNRRVAVAVALSAVTAASLAYSSWLTGANPSAAYFVTPTRVWQFGAGALLALHATRSGAGSTGPGRLDTVRALLSWAGVAALLWCGFAFTAATPFPGTAALVPVLGALAVIAAGAPGGRLSPVPLMSLRPVQYVGDVSYAVYLWHWPPIVLLPYVLGHDLRTVDKASILLGTFLLAALTKRYVEDPVRLGTRFGIQRRSVTFALTALVAAGLVGASALGTSAATQAAQRGQAAVADLLKHPPRCFGAASMDPRKPCHNPALDAVLVPAPEAQSEPANPECFPEPADDRLKTCDFGEVGDRSVPRVVLIGDSHARALLPALKDLAARGDISVTTVLKSSCAWSTRRLEGQDALRERTCEHWRSALATWVDRHVTRSDVVLTSAYTLFLTGTREERVQGLSQAWSTVTRRGIPVVAVRDSPRFHHDPNLCLARLSRVTPDSCSRPRARAFPSYDAITPAAERTSGVHLVDLTDFYCTARRCRAVIGGVNAFYDRSHLSVAFSRTLAPYLWRDLRALKVLGGSGGH